MQIDGQGFSIRPATSDDFEQILTIERAAYPFPWTQQAFLEELQKPFSKFLVLTDDATDSVVSGYVVFWMLFDEVHLLNVAVAQEWKGLGIGKLLVRQAMNEAIHKEFKRIFLEVRKSNQAAIGLYQKLGFFIDHVKKNFYENGEDAYFMVRFFDQKDPLMSDLNGRKYDA